MPGITEGCQEMAHGRKGITLAGGSPLFPQQALPTPLRPRRLEQRTTQLLDRIDQKRQQHQRGNHPGEVLIAVATVVCAMRALILQGGARVSCEAPARPRPPHALIPRAFVDTPIGDPVHMVALAGSRRRPALDAMAPQVGLGGIARQGRDKTKPMGHGGFAIVTRRVGHTTGVLSPCNLRAQQGVGSFFAPENGMPMVVWQRLDMGGMRPAALCADDPLEMRGILPKRGDAALGRVALAIIVLRAVVCDHRLGHAGNDCSSVRVEQRGATPLMAISHRALVVVFFPTRRAVYRLGGTIPRAVEGPQRMARDTPHLCEHCATLEPAQPNCTGRSQGRGLHSIEGLPHRRSTGDLAQAGHALPIVCGPLLGNGASRGRFAGQHGAGGQQGVRQRDVGLTFAVIRHVAQAVVNRAHQGRGAQMVSHCGNPDAPRNLQPHMES